jgi:hypothetical protein
LDMVVEFPVEIYLKNWVYYHLYRNIYFPYYFLYCKIKLSFHQTLIHIILLLDIDKICIYLKLI